MTMTMTLAMTMTMPIANPFPHGSIAFQRVVSRTKVDRVDAADVDFT